MCIIATIVPPMTKVTDASNATQESSTQPSNPWTLKEYGGKQLWDWMDLLIVPFVLALVTVVFTWQQESQQTRLEEQRAESERRVEEQRAQDAALQDYFDQMTQLILDRQLL